MDIKKLRYFLAVADDSSFSKAARRLGVGQSILSRAVKDLEEKAGAELFVRGQNVTKLTPSGEAFVPKVEEALRAIEEGLSAVREVSAGKETVLDVGYLPSSYESFAGDAISTFCQTFPHISLVPHPSNAGPMIDGLRRGKLDVALIGYICPELEREFDAFRICRVPLQIVIAEHHPLAGKERARLNEFASCPLISLNSTDFPGRHELISGICQDEGLKPFSIRRVDSLASVLANIVSSNAFSLMPAEVQSIATSHVRFLDIDGGDYGIEIHGLVKQGENRKSVLTFLRECRRIALSKT